jgi:hypothetical protein
VIGLLKRNPDDDRLRLMPRPYTKGDPGKTKIEPPQRSRWFAYWREMSDVQAKIRVGTSPGPGSIGMSGSMNETLDDLTDDWAAVKLVPDDTGCQWRCGSPKTMVIRMTSASRSPPSTAAAAHGVRRRRWACGPIRTKSGLAVYRPSDVQAAAHWIELNHKVILDLWNGLITSRQVYPRLRKVP